MVLSFLCGLIIGWCCCYYSCHFSVSQPILHLSLSYKLFCASLCAYLDRIYWIVCLANPLLATIHPPSASYTGGGHACTCNTIPWPQHTGLGVNTWSKLDQVVPSQEIQFGKERTFSSKMAEPVTHTQSCLASLFPSRCLGRRESLCTDTHSKEQRWETKMESYEHMSWEGGLQPPAAVVPYNALILATPEAEIPRHPRIFPINYLCCLS